MKLLRHRRKIARRPDAGRVLVAISAYHMIPGNLYHINKALQKTE